MIATETLLTAEFRGTPIAAYPARARLCGIYMYDNRVSGRKYVGRSIDIHGRLRDHAKDKRMTKFHRALRKHGPEAFDITVLELCEPADLQVKETFWILFFDAIDCGYNLKLMDTGASAVAPETRARISAGNLGKVRTAETRAKIGDANRGKVLSAETRAKISAANLGRNTGTRSAETRAKISAARMGRSTGPRSEEARLNMRIAQQKRRQNELV